MSRVKTSVTTRARHKKILKQAKGYYGRRKSTFRVANQAVEKAGQYAYRDRRVRKRMFKSLWIQRINAGCRLHGLKYSTFINGLKKINLNLNRKVLADLAAQEPMAFKKIVNQIKLLIKINKCLMSRKKTENTFSIIAIVLGGLAFLFFPPFLGGAGVIVAVIGKTKNEKLY